jgi:hypothetical protein
MRGVRELAVLAVWTLTGTLSPRPGAADGGTMRLVESTGPFVVAVFSTPEPLRVAPADLSVLILERTDGRPVLDAAVALDLRPPVGSTEAPQRLEATHAEATNKLLYAAPFRPTIAGEWTLHVTVERGTEAADVGCPLPVAPDRAALVAIWPYLAIPPVAVALYALRAWLSGRRRQRTPASTRSASPRSATAISTG